MKPSASPPLAIQSTFRRLRWLLKPMVMAGVGAKELFARTAHSLDCWSDGKTPSSPSQRPDRKYVNSSRRPRADRLYSWKYP